MKYRVHRFDMSMRRDIGRLEEFLNSLDGEVVAVIPNVYPSIVGAAVDFVLVVERAVGSWPSFEALTRHEKSPEDLITLS